jgi:soluble lytic murein transglycosylase-like protein
LFQLNSRSFPKLSEREFFDPDLNARYGIAHLRWCLDLGGTEVPAWPCTTREPPGSGKTARRNRPRLRLRILAFKAGLDSLFGRELGTRWLVSAEGEVKSLAPRRSWTTSAPLPPVSALNGGSR